MTRDDRIILSKMNKKRAYFSMSGAALLLFVSSLLSYAMTVGCSFLLGLYTDSIQHGLTSFLSALGIDKMRAFSAVRQLFASGILIDFFNILIVIFAMVIPALIYARFKGQTHAETFNLNGKTIKHFLPMFCLCQLITTVSSAFSQSIFDFVVPMAKTYSSAGVVTDAGVFSLVMSVLSTCILVPVAEEYLFRGVIFSHLRKHGLMFGIIGSATLFGIAHSSPVQSVYAFAFGILSAFFAAVSGNIKTSIIFHSLNNLVTVLIDYCSGNVDETLMMLFYCVYYIAVLFLAFVGIYHLVKSGGLMDELKEQQHLCDGELIEHAGMKEVMCVPVVLYVLLYAFDFVIGVFA